MNRRKVLLLVATLVATLGTALVFVYVQGAESRAVAKFDNVDVLRAVAVIEPGETIDAAAASGKLQLEPVPKTLALPGAVTSIDTIAGKSANTRIFPGEQILGDKFGEAGDASLLPIPQGKVAISVQLTDTSRVAGFVKAGSQVAVFLNGTDASSQKPFTRLLLPDATVIAVGSTTPTPVAVEEGQVPVEQLPATLLTLALDQVEAQRVMFATTNGELTFALRNSSSSVAKDLGVTAENLFG